MPGFSILGAVAGIEEALVITTQQHPDVVILDWSLADGYGRDYLSRLSSSKMSSPGLNKTQVLVFSANSSDMTVHEALSLGAAGFIEKTATFSDFKRTLRCVSMGVSEFGPLVAKALQRILRRPERCNDEIDITPRERDVLRFVAEGLSSKEIAATLGLSVRTVENHRASIFRRTGLRSIAQLTLLAVRLGLVDAGSSRVA